MASGTCGKNLTWSLSYGTLTISGTGAMTNFIAPRSNFFYFEDRTGEESPWKYSSEIEKIIISDGVTSIGDQAFSCRNLTSVTIPDSVTYIGEHAFSSCDNLRNVILPSSITYIGQYAFSWCKSLRNITIPGSLRMIRFDTFKRCDNLTSIIISDGVKELDSCAFRDCKALRELKIPESVTKIDHCAFEGCENLTKVEIPQGITKIEWATFRWCKSLQEINLPDSVTEIYSEAFSGCSSLREITIPERVVSVGKAYSDVSPRPVFGDCTSLRRIYYRAGSGFESKLSMGNNAELIPVTPKIPTWKVENIKLTVGGTDKIKDYSKETPPWHDYLKTVQRIVIEDGVKEISANAFSNVLRLEHVTIPASVTTIGDMAFKFSCCGDREIDGGKNVLWNLERGILVIKKNPAAKSDADFSTGYESWNVVEKNFKAIKIECGIIPSKRFFEWLWQSGRDVQIKFV